MAGWPTEEMTVRFAWIDERPFGYSDARGTLTGCDVALAAAACALMGEEFEPVHTTFAEMLPGLAQNRWDATTGMFITAERREVAHFTRAIWSLRDGLLLPTASHPDDAGVGIDGYRSLASAGGRLAVLRGQVQALHAGACGIPVDRLLVHDTYDEASTAVLEGRVTAYASVALAHQQHIAARPERALRWIAVPEPEAAAAVGGFACADPGLVRALDAALEHLLPAGPPGEPSPDPARWPPLPEGPLRAAVDHEAQT